MGINSVSSFRVYPSKPVRAKALTFAGSKKPEGSNNPLLDPLLQRLEPQSPLARRLSLWNGHFVTGGSLGFILSMISNGIAPPFIFPMLLAAAGYYTNTVSQALEILEAEEAKNPPANNDPPDNK